MGMFSNVDNDEPASRGLFSKLKGWRTSFTESTPAASMPIAGVEPRFESAKPAATPRSTAAEPVAGQPMTLGMRLRMADVTDVDVHDPLERGGAPRGTPDEPTATGDTAPEAPLAAPASDGDAEIVAPATASVVEPVRTISQPEDREPVAQTTTPDMADRGTDLIAPEVTITPTGLPQLVSADAITFKRILCERSADAALKITDAARREFIAVDLQAGVAIVVATKRFHETAFYSTYLKDLVRADIAVREEMIATEEVIAALYASEKNRSAAIVPESSRAIGTFRDVMEAAHAYGASDVHWEYRDFNDEVELRFRVNGDLYSYRNMPKALVRRALSAAYQDLVQRNTNSGETFQPSAPQSAMIPLVAQMDLLNLRWQSTSLVGGFDVALRLLDGNFRNYKVRLPGEMGLEQSQLRIIESLGNVSGGVTILTGETGSAKTTLLRAFSFLMTSRDLRKQFAVNEPSEYPMPWLSDISIPRRPDESDDEANRKCAEVIRSLMRMDPDDVTVGEIRDRVVASLVAELALTGHPVRTSLHADSAIGAFMRLAGGRLQLPMDEVSSGKFINAVGNQKLIPLLCPHCKRPANDVMPAAQLELLRSKFGLDTSKMACRDEEGCDHCRLPGLLTRAGKVAAGTKGQTLAMELFRPTPEFLEQVAVRDWRGAEKVWRAGRLAGFGEPDMTGKTIYEHALYKASVGLIDPRFIDESMKPFEEYRVFADCDGRMPS
ncbi:ATPase, T2SS/T4P/T4SS family [Paraburkholderia rhizosphaerae]|uniref:Type II secretory ATPase GspE/PulE/Tfp pilus assembly ATPase PilB-like protein n=1 Tax=Paraburkholderia rhizosphaerae TaxID=480658 RepID=A0A4R8LQV7_9BURK|nr:ATPase, T2SS/T4P/T4SS family [Paraburkholderia rhizosphaerae]TDY48270.1 type II secretory ATPase GspE/PulE/Tfp pilus assembly ATPase PilB-like protein [Paraburkholderia rhizosphaerae]